MLRSSLSLVSLPHFLIARKSFWVSRHSLTSCSLPILQALPLNYSWLVWYSSIRRFFSSIRRQILCPISVSSSLSWISLVLSYVSNMAQVFIFYLKTKTFTDSMPVSICTVSFFSLVINGPFLIFLSILGREKAVICSVYSILSLLFYYTCCFLPSHSTSLSLFVSIPPLPPTHYTPHLQCLGSYPG